MQAKIVEKNGMNVVEINGKTFEFTAYRSWRPQEKYLKAFNDREFPFMTLLPSGIKNSLGTPYSEFGEYWKGDGIYDWDILRAQMDQFVKNAPDTYLAINLMLDTRDWFLREHPECLNSFIYFSAVCTYKVWRECAARMLKDTIDFLEREYPEKVFAIFLSAGGTCEWHNKALDLPKNPLHEALYREWTGNPEATIPTEEEIQACENGIFRNPKTQKNVIEFLQFTNDAINDTLTYFAKLVKEHTGGRLLVGAPAGYVLVGEYPLSGHSEAGEVMKNPYLDIIVCPASYYHRQLDGVSGSQAAMDSIRINHKLMVHSIDNTTYAANGHPCAQIMQYSHCRHESMAQSIHYIRRECALAMSKGAGFWFFDMYGCWYPDASWQDELARIKAVYHDVVEKGVEFNAEIAVLADSRSYIYTNKGDLIKLEQVQEQIQELGRIGAPVDYYFMDDILLEQFPAERYKLYLLPNAFVASEKVRKKIAELKEAGASFLFCGAAGAITEEGFSYKAASEFTGIELAEDTMGDSYTLVEERYNDSGAPKIYAGTRKGKILPVMVASDNQCEVWGRDFLREVPRLVCKERHKGFDAWSFRGTVPSCVLRRFAEKAGVFLYQKDGLPTYANSRMVCFFDHKGGKHEITFPHKGKLVEAFTGAELKVGEEALCIEFAENECKLFIYEE